MPIRRAIKNVVNNFSDAQVKVREATSNDPWGPSSTIMSEIADMTYNVMAYTEIMQMIWKRLNDKNKNWRHVYKALVLLEYIIKTGSEKVAQQCRENIFAVQSLGDFQFIEENKDHGLNVREKAKQLVVLLKDDEKLKVERAKALKAKERLQLGGIQLYPCSSTTDKPVSSFGGHAEIATGAEGEEELQLQLALAISKEEHEQDQKRRQQEDHREDMKLRMAMEASKKEENAALAPLRPPPSHSSHNLSTPSSSTQSSMPSWKSADTPLGSSQRSGGLLDLIDTSLSVAPAGQADVWASDVISPSSVDPWANSMPQISQASSASAFEPWNGTGRTAVSPAWSSTTPVIVAAPQDDFELLSDSRAALKANGAASSEPWDMDGLVGALGGSHNSLLDSTNPSLDENKKPGTAGFLGEHASLVSLDDLLTKPKTTNPFALTQPSTLMMGGAPSHSNPFAATQPPKVSLNQLQHQQYNSAASGGLSRSPVAFAPSVMQPLIPLAMTSITGNAAAEASGAMFYPQSNNPWGGVPHQPSATASGSINPFL